MTRVECEAELKEQKDAGYYPICLQGGGTTAQPVYAAIFAKQDISDFLGRKDVAEIPLRREWSVTSDAAPNWGESFDTIFQDFMKANGVRAAQFALSKNDSILLSRGYTWAEPGYRSTTPSDRFLLASCSKLFCARAIQTLFDEFLLEPSTRAYPLLGFSTPADPRSDSITIQQLLDHRGGYNHGTNSNLPNSTDQDPTYDMREIGRKLNPPRKVEKLDVVRYMYGKQLQYTPGEGEAYSNYGYLLLSAIVEHRTGKPYFQYVQEMVLAPLGLTDVRLSSTQAQQRDPNQAICEDQGLGPDPINVTSDDKIPNVYGGDRQIKEVAAGSAGLTSSARVLAQFAGSYFRARGNLPQNFAGSTPGAISFVRSLPNGIDWGYVLNTRDFVPPRPGENTAEDILKGKIGDKIESMPELR
jgi:CubicO group peptidase (beta-lactamase class C family)